MGKPQRGARTSSLHSDAGNFLQWIKIFPTAQIPQSSALKPHDNMSACRSFMSAGPCLSSRYKGPAAFKQEEDMRRDMETQVFGIAACLTLCGSARRKHAVAMSYNYWQFTLRCALWFKTPTKRWSQLESSQRLSRMTQVALQLPSADVNKGESKLCHFARRRGSCSAKDNSGSLMMKGAGP